MKAKFLLILCVAVVAVSCTYDSVSTQVKYADAQFRYLVSACEPGDTATLLPRALSNNGDLIHETPLGWTSGFFP